VAREREMNIQRERERERGREKESEPHTKHAVSFGEEVHKVGSHQRKAKHGNVH
jgi:hypothetical protein